MLAGQLVALWISIGALLWAPKPVPLEYSIAGCDNNVLSSVNFTSMYLRGNSTLPVVEL